jgi:Ser/Thr protein kinase RdoA (MazF antagonist)
MMQTALYAYEMVTMTAEFSSLDRSGQVARLDKLAREALIYYGLNFAVPTLVNYTNNAVYHVDAGTHHYALRLHRPGVKHLQWIQSELAWLKALRHETDLRVPQPAAPVYEGSLEGYDHPVYATLFRWEKGEAVTPSNLTEKQAYSVGVFAAKLHHTKLSIDFQRPSRDAEGLFGARSTYQPTAEGEALFSDRQRVIMNAAIEEVKAVMAHLDTDREANFGMIHADLIAKNLLFDGDTVVALDFDDCGYGYYLYDLAPMLLSFKDEPNGEALRSALWAGYTSLRPQVTHQEAFLETLIAARHIASIRWVASNLSNPSIKDKAADIISYRVGELKRFLETGRL